MADSSLDDFFAKKDRSRKSKSRSKYTTSDTIAKNLEDGGGKRIESIPRKDTTKEKVPLSTNNQSISISSTTNEQPLKMGPAAPKGQRQSEDDEWKNIEEKERDYSGLRIQALSISEKEKEEEQLKEQMLSEQNGESSKSSDGQSGPWKVMQGPTSAEVEEEKPPVEPEVKEAPEVVVPAKTTGAYVPPALRNVSSGGTYGSSASSKRYSGKNAPPISSELHFPSLSSTAEERNRYSEIDKSFQSVKHGVRSTAETQKELKIDIGNKFSALPQGE